MSDDNFFSACRSDIEISSLFGDIQIDGFRGLTKIPAAGLELDSGDTDTKARRAEMITAVRGGQHVELAVNATTWRQRPAPNRRGLRLHIDNLTKRAPTWKAKPFLTDHNTRAMASVQGTILSSKLIEESALIHSFEQGLHVVKPDAVIGMLDGTMRSFSISWFALGPVMCSVHHVDVQSSDSCGCWPLDVVMVDGKPQVVQYEFGDYEGKETSTVVVGGVRDTSVDSVRVALSAELQLHPRRPHKETRMAFMKLAAALSLATLAEADEAAAVTAVVGLQQRAAAGELEAGQRGAEITRLTTENAGLREQVNVAATQAIDGLLADAYKAGKLVFGKDAEGKNVPDALEDLLRAFGNSSGRPALEAKLAAMKQVAPVGVAPIALLVKEAAKSTLNAVPDENQIRETALQLGIPEDELRASFGMSPRAVGGAR